MEIIKKEENNVEFYTVDLTGQSGMSQSGLAILAGVSRTTLQNLEKTLATVAPSKWLEPFVGESLTLATGDSPRVNGKPQGNLKIYKSRFCAAVLQHFADPDTDIGLSEELKRQQKDTAMKSCLYFLNQGIESWIQQITGWKQRHENLKPYTDVYIQRLQRMRDHQIEDHLWMVFREASELFLLVEKDWRVPVNDFDLLDGSIGKRWCVYRDGQEWAREIHSYTHIYRDRRGAIECNAFEYSELPYFKRWLKEVYILDHLPSYLIGKYGKQAVRQIYNEIGGLTDSILELTEIKRLSPQEEQRYQDFLHSRQSLLSGIQ